MKTGRDVRDDTGPKLTLKPTEPRARSNVKGVHKGNNFGHVNLTTTTCPTSLRLVSMG